MGIGARLACGVLTLLALPAAAQNSADQRGLAADEGAVVVYAATDAQVVQPLIRDFETLHPGVRVDYHDMNSTELYHRFKAEADAGGGADVAWSSAMDLQVKLVNDGYAQPHYSAETGALPAWAVWKNEAFGTTYEPIAMVYNKRALAENEIPHTHAELLRLLAAQPERFLGRVTTYDPERSGVGFLFHSQDVQANPVVFWSLARAFGEARAELKSRTGDMLESVAAGDTLIAYNVLGSYALTRAQNDPALGVVLPRDYTLVMSRVIFIARNAPHPNAARLWVDYLLSPRGQALLAKSAGLFSVRGDVADDTGAAELKHQLGGAFRPIAIGSGLLAYLDQAKRRDFVRKWRGAMNRHSSGP